MTLEVGRHGHVVIPLGDAFAHEICSTDWPSLSSTLFELVPALQPFHFHRFVSLCCKFLDFPSPTPVWPFLPCISQETASLL